MIPESTAIQSSTRADKFNTRRILQITACLAALTVTSCPNVFCQKMIMPPNVPRDTMLVQKQDTFSNRAFGYSFQVPADYRVKGEREGDFDIYRDSFLSLEVRAEEIDDYYLRRAKEIDSLDIVKGFALARASDECALDGDEGTVHLTADTIADFRNQFGVRILEVHQSLHESKESTPRLNRVTYFIDLSLPHRVRGLMIPRGCGALEYDRSMPLAVDVVQTIRRLEPAK